MVVARTARAEDPTPAETAVDDPLVPLDDLATLEIPEDDLTFDEALIGLPIVRVEVRVTGKRWAAKPAISSVKFGEKLTPEAARRAMRELAGAGSFVRLAAEAERAGSGALLRIVAVPSRTVAAVQLDGGVLDRAGTLRAANIVQGEEVSESELDAIPAKIGAFYDLHGFPNAVVTIQAAQLDDPLDVLVVVTIDPKEPRLVSQRIFVIEPHDDAHVGDLKFDYAVKAGDRLDDAALSEADRALSQALREEGFYKARISHKTKIIGPFSYLYVYVESGPKLVPIFEGNRSFDADQLREALEIDEGQIGSTEELVSKLAKFYESHGFLDAQVKVVPRESKDPGLEYVAFDIIENDRARVSRRVFVCLAKDVDPDDVGSEIDGVLETVLPSHTFLSVPDPRIVDQTLTTTANTGARPAPLSLTPATTYTPEAYTAALKRVREVFLAKGYLNAVIGPVTVVRARCAADSPAEGCIEEPMPELRGACKTTDAGLPLPEPAAPQDVTCVPNPAKGIRCSPDLTLRIPVHLGPITKVWDLAFEGNAHATAKELAEAAKLELGAPLSLQALEDAKGRIAEYYQDRGYAYVGIASDVELSPDRTRGRVKFVLQERDLVFIEDIDIEGATRTDHALIRRRIAFKKGDVYSKTGIRLSEERLATLGVFASTSVALADPEVVSRRKRLVVRVSEYPSQYIDPKVGFSTGEGLRFGFEYGHRNIGSLAIALTLRIQLSYLFDFMILDPDVERNLAPLSASERLERRNSVRVAFPEIGLGPLVSFGIEAVDVRDNQRDFGLSREAIVPNLTYRPVREVVATLSASVELNDEKIFNGDSIDEAIRKDPRLANLLRFPDGTTLAVAQRIGVSWDRRDTPFAATRGTLVTVDVEHVNALPADPDDPDTDPLVSHFMKMSGRFSGYIRFTDSGIALAASIAVGANVQLQSGSKTYPDRLFYLGGFDSIRSFLAESVIPEDVAQQILDDQLVAADVAVRGGDFFWNPRLELRVPVTGTFALGFFLDTGNLWVDPLNFIPWHLRYGLGLGLRITTPIGPLAFDYGFNVDPRPWEDIGALHFSIGLF
ncbi:MAG: BamA/TamA family outer membrane protein [Polyangiaceae bacterium]|nr:BamA/TamA family outer membrane protein [Polyangiaceae bacterium]